MQIGTYYYPEQWPRDQWERDFDHMVTLGLQLVHMGEFAWFDLEPEEGKFQFDWLNHCIDLATKHKLRVILCTPTAAPPIWLVQKHPEILPLDPFGRRMRFGGRRHYSPTSPAYQDATRRIVTAMVQHFGANPAIAGWQIDNEYSSDFFDQNDHAIAAWRQWLRTKYGRVEALNTAWGCQFWTSYYTDFEQIQLPYSRDPGYSNPHAVLDACRFWSWAFGQFNRIQTEIVRKGLPIADCRLPIESAGQRPADAPPASQSATANRQSAISSGLSTQDSALQSAIGNRQSAIPFVTTNFMPGHPDLNPADVAGDFNLMAWDAYPCSGCDVSPKDQSFRIGDPNLLGLMHGYMAGFHGRWGQMELQLGQVNWGHAPVQLFPGAVRLWLWTAFAHGAEFTTTYRFRQARFGIEMFHHGLMGTDGITPSPGGRQFQQTIDELARIDLKAIDSAPAANTPSVGLVFDFEQLWWFKILPQAKRWDYLRLMGLWYGALARLGLHVVVLRPEQAWPQELPLIVAPGLQMVDEPLIQKMTSYAAAGGHLVLTCRTGTMDRTGQFFDGPTGKPILPLIDGSIEAYDGLPDGATGLVDLDGKKYPWSVWGDLLYSAEDTRILAKYADQFYEGAAAVIQNKVDKGIVTYCGVFGEEEFTNALAEKLATQSKLPITPLPPRVQLLRRGPYRVLLNYSLHAVDAPAPPRTRFVLGTRKVEPAGVAVWKEASAT